MRSKLLAIIPLLVAIYIGYDMIQRQEDQLLWGWRPFFLWITVWGAVLLTLGKHFSRLPQSVRLLGLSTGSGVLLSLAFPASPLTPLVFVGLVPLLIVEDTISKERKGPARWQVFKYAFNAFLIWNISTTWWVLNTSFMPGVVANVLNAILMATVFMLFHLARHALAEKFRPFLFCVFWIAFEYLHLFWDISWPWLHLGHMFAQYPSWVQWYEYTGVFGGSLWVLLANYWIWQWWSSDRKQNKRALVGFVLWIIIPIGVSLIRYMTYPLQDGEVEVVVVQPNFEPHYQKFDIPKTQQLDRFVTLSEEAITPQTDYVVFPETSFGYVLLNEVERDPHIARLREMIRPYPELNLITGIESYRVHDTRVDLESLRIRESDGLMYDVQNSAIQLTTGVPIDPYFKSKLVPGAEFFPFREWLPFIKPLVSMLQGSVAGVTKQEMREVFTSNVATVAPAICYESVYGAYVGEYVKLGADVIFVVTNDGWWDRTPGHRQHLKLATLRAIEHRRPVARSANTGISCFINQRGDILQPTQYDEATAIRGTIDPGTGFTFYTRWGDIIARLSVFLTIILMALGISRGLMQRTNERSAPLS